MCVRVCACEIEERHQIEEDLFNFAENPLLRKFELLKPLSRLSQKLSG